MKENKFGNLLSRLGMNVNKAKVDVNVSDEVKSQNKRMTEARKAQYARDTLDTAEMYAAAIPDEFLATLMEHNDYLCLQWGSRKLGRMLNICRNIVDIEVHTEGQALKAEEQPDVLRMLMWMCLLFPIPLKKHMRMKNVEAHYSPLFKKWLLEDYSVIREYELDVVLAGVFDGVNTKEGNPVLDIFHDALRLEEAQFNMKPDPSTMRTVLGRNPVFSIHTQKKSAANLAPHWLFQFQIIKGLTGFVDEVSARKDEDYSEGDGIST